MATAWRWILPILASSASSCTVMYDLNGYASGGLPDGSADSALETGTDAGLDTAAPVDATALDSVVDSTTKIDATSDSGADTISADSAKDDSIVADDTATVGSDGAVSDAAETGGDAAADAPAPGCHLVLNEVQTRSVASGFDEFIEVYNPCDAEVLLSGWKLAYRSASGTTESNLVTFASTATIAAKGFLIAANSGGSFASSADVTFTSGIADDGSLGLRNPAGSLVDSVGWGAAASTNPFVEKAAALGPASGASISRVPNGADSDDNSADFKRTSPATPKS